MLCGSFRGTLVSRFSLSLSLFLCRARVTSAQALEALRKAEKERKLKEERDYINPAISAEEKAKGNDAFKRGDYPEVRLSLSLSLSVLHFL